jgi:hypothetical protein
VAPVNKALFGGWEGNWVAWNTAHDVSLPHTKGPQLGFLMYPQAENANGRYDSGETLITGWQVAIADQEIGSAQLAFNSAEDLSWTFAIDLTDDRHARPDARVASRFPRRHRFGS